MVEPQNFIWEIQRLSRSHDRSEFDCGQPALNQWLQRQVTQYEKRDLARAYVAVRPGEVQVAGYYAISMHGIRPELLTTELAKGLPGIDVPVVLLGRLAVDRTVQGQGLGSLLLVDAMRRTDYLSQAIGVRAIEVQAIDDGARDFYLRFGFVQLQDDPHHLILPIQVARNVHTSPSPGDS